MGAFFQKLSQVTRSRLGEVVMGRPEIHQSDTVSPCFKHVEPVWNVDHIVSICQYICWLVVVEPYPSEKYELDSWDDYSQYTEKWKSCSKPPTSFCVATQTMDFDAQWCGPPHNEPTICGWCIQAIQMVILVQMALSKNHSSTPRPPPGFQNKALVLQDAGNATIRQVPIVLSSRYHGFSEGKTSPTSPPSWPKKKGEDWVCSLGRKHGYGLVIMCLSLGLLKMPI